MDVGGRVSTRQISSGEGRRTAKTARAFWWTVSAGWVVKAEDRPLTRRRNSFVADWKRRRNVRCFVDRLVQHRAAEPDDVFGVVVFDLGRIRVVQRHVVRRKMTVCDGVSVVRTGLVDVLRRQCRRERQERRNEDERSGAGQPDHKEIIGGVS